MKKHLVIFAVLCLTVLEVVAQLPRERSNDRQVVAELFWATSVIILPSVTQIPKDNINFSIQHVFGNVSSGISELFGLDASANIRFGLDYGISDQLSVGLGRSRFDKVVDAGFKWNVLQQSEAFPLYASAIGNIAFDTRENGYSTSDRQSYFVGLLLARKVSESLSIQLSPSWAHFNLARDLQVFGGGIESEKNDLFGLGMSGRYALSDQVSLMAEWIPMLGGRSDGSHDVVSVGANLETGGHVFQVFLSTSQWITPQYAMSRTRDSFSDGEVSFGFTVHRVFGIQ